MLLISRYIIKELILPFIYSLMIIVLMLFINFFLRAIDRFLGKGLSVVTIFEYLFLNLAWIVALAVPMAVLIATLMAFGRMSEDNEINAMRASGISFTSILKPYAMRYLGRAIKQTPTKKRPQCPQPTQPIYNTVKRRSTSTICSNGS